MADATIGNPRAEIRVAPGQTSAPLLRQAVTTMYDKVVTLMPEYSALTIHLQPFINELQKPIAGPVPTEAFARELLTLKRMAKDLLIDIKANPSGDFSGAMQDFKDLLEISKGHGDFAQRN